MFLNSVADAPKAQRREKAPDEPARKRGSFSTASPMRREYCAGKHQTSHPERGERFSTASPMRREHFVGLDECGVRRASDWGAGHGGKLVITVVDAPRALWDGRMTDESAKRSARRDGAQDDGKFRDPQ